MYNEIRTWVNTKFSTLAGVTSTDFREVISVGDLIKASAPQKDISYIIQLEKSHPYEKAESESWRVVLIAVKMCFLITKNSRVDYQTAIDTYLRPLEKYFKADIGVNDTTGTFTITQIADAQLEDLDKFEGSYLMPTLKFNLLCNDP